MKALRRALTFVRYLPLLLRRAVVKGWHDRILGLSAEAAFWQMLSLPSLFLALIATLGYVSRWFGPGTVDGTETEIENTLGRAFSDQVVAQVITPILHEVLRGDRADVISVGFVLALWAGSSATATFVNTISIAYGQRDLRGAVRSRLLALWMFLATVLLGVVLLPMLVLGPDLLRRALPRGARATVSSLIEAGYYPVLIVLLIIGLTTFYKLAPPRRLPWRRGLPGAVLAMLVFLAGSTGLRGYIHFILDKNHAYGTLAAPIAALLFFYVLALGVLLGAELNAAIEQLRPAQARVSRLDPRYWQLFHPESPSHPESHSESVRDVAEDQPAEPNPSGAGELSEPTSQVPSLPAPTPQARQRTPTSALDARSMVRAAGRRMGRGARHSDSTLS